MRFSIVISYMMDVLCSFPFFEREKDSSLLLGGCLSLWSSNIYILLLILGCDILLAITPPMVVPIIKKQVLVRNTGSDICTQSSLLKLVANKQRRAEQKSGSSDL